MTLTLNYKVIKCGECKKEIKCYYFEDLGYCSECYEFICEECRDKKLENKNNSWDGEDKEKLFCSECNEEDDLIYE